MDLEGKTVKTKLYTQVFFLIWLFGWVHADTEGADIIWSMVDQQCVRRISWFLNRTAIPEWDRWVRVACYHLQGTEWFENSRPVGQRCAKKKADTATNPNQQRKKKSEMSLARSSQKVPDNTASHGHTDEQSSNEGRKKNTNRQLRTLCSLNILFSSFRVVHSCPHR